MEKKKCNCGKAALPSLEFCTRCLWVLVQDEESPQVVAVQDPGEVGLGEGAEIRLESVLDPEYAAEEEVYDYRIDLRVPTWANVTMASQGGFTFPDAPPLIVDGAKALSWLHRLSDELADGWEED